jgi:hypothetical protein
MGITVVRAQIPEKRSTEYRFPTISGTNHKNIYCTPKDWYYWGVNLIACCVQTKINGEVFHFPRLCEAVTKPQLIVSYILRHYEKRVQNR